MAMHIFNQDLPPRLGGSTKKAFAKPDDEDRLVRVDFAHIELRVAATVARLHKREHERALLGAKLSSGPTNPRNTMDPISAILSVFTKDLPRREAVADLSSWYARKGAHPTLKEIEEEAARRMIALPRTWRVRAIKLGATQ